MIKSDRGEILELKEPIVVNEDGSEAPKSGPSWLLGVKPGGLVAGVLAAFAIPAIFFFGLIFLGGFLSLAALVLLFQPLARRSSGTDSQSSR